MTSATPRPAWDDLGPRPAPRLPVPPPGRLTADLVVVGLGASGLAAVRRAAGRGADVVGVDAVGVAAGAAGRNGGFLLTGGARFHHDAVATWGRATALALHRVSAAELDRVAAAHPAAVRRTGSLRIAASAAESGDVAAQLTAMRADGLAAEAYDGPEGRGLLVPGDGVVHPVERARRDAAAALGAGARLFAPCRVTALGDGAVTTDVGEVVCRAVVVAVDGGLEDVAPELAGRVRTTRLQMCATAPTGPRFPRPVYRRWGYDYVVQVPSGQVLFGGCRDRYEDREWGAPAEPSAEVQRCLDRRLRDLGVDAPVTHRWAARAAFTDDRLPVCERLRPGVWAVGAYSGHGNLLGTWCARRAADVALDGRNLRLPDALAADPGSR